MVKSLTNIVYGLKKRLKKSLVLASTIPFLFLAGCNYRPQTILSVYPNSGQAPLETNIQVDGTDLNGKEDIMEYQLIIDREGTENDETITQENPIDVTRTFYDAEVITVSGKSTDLRRASDSKTTTINVTESPNYYISLEKINDIDIRYDILLPNINQAVLTIKRNNELIHTQTIDSDYNGTLEGMLKGDYTFTLKSLDETVIEADGITIPNYTPEVDLGIIPENEKNFNEESQIILDLPIPTDRNPEDNPVPYMGATSLEGKVEILSVNGNQLEIEGNEDETGPYQLELEFGTSQGGTSTNTLEGSIANLVDISGTLESNEEDNVGKAGTIKIYESLEDTNPLEVPVSSSGIFGPIQLENVVSEAILQAELNMGSYIRTIRVDGTQDYSGPIRAVPYDDFGVGITEIQFRTFVDNINFQNYGTSLGLWKWNFGEFPEIQERFEQIIACKEYQASFPPEYDTVEYWQDFLTTHKVSQLVDRTSLPVSIADKFDDIPSPLNKVIIFPWDKGANDIFGSEIPIDLDSNGYIDRVSIMMNIYYVDDPLFEAAILHEFGHAFIAPHGEAGSVLPYELTIMRAGSRLTPGPADIKAASIVYEDTYLGGEKLNDILGLNFLDEP